MTPEQIIWTKRGLEYGRSIVSMFRSGSLKHVAYHAAMDDVDLFLRAAIERIEAGEEMHSVAHTQGIHNPDDVFTRLTQGKCGQSLSDTFHEIEGAAATASSVGWSHSRFTYTKEQLKWIGQLLHANGGSVWKVLEIMSDPTSNFPGAEVHCRTFKDSALWACMIEKVQRCLSGLSQFGDWDSEIRGQAAEEDHS